MWVFESDEHDSLQRIVQGENLTALFQPIIDLESAEIFGYEGLVRGPSDSPLHSPSCLFKAASECDLLCDVEGLCHKILVEEFVRLKLPGKLFLNVSPEALVRQMNETFRYALFHGGINPGRIVIELIESGPSAHVGPEKIRESLEKFCGEGYSVAIDDLGEGFSNFRLWSELRPNFVKIDRHFIQNIDQDPLKVKFVRSIQDIAGSVGTLVIAEGIETHAELMVVKSMGVRYGQGYHIARPHPAPGAIVAMDVARTIKSFSSENVPWGRDSITARGIVHADIPVNARQTNAEILRLFEEKPDLETVAVVKDDGVPVGLITRPELINNFARRYRHELFGKNACTQFMDARPLMVDKAATVQEVSKLLVTADRRHLMQGFIVLDDGRYFGIAYGQDLVRVITEMQLQAAKYANPLTQLPGNVPIHEHMDSLLRAKIPFCACYCDLDHFKPFNDLYGFSAGDAVLQLAANVLSRACDHDMDFLGHIGGDDFIILFRSSNWKERCEAALDEFGESIRNFFGQEDIDRGGYYTENRRYEKEFHPLTSLSIGAVVIPPGLFTSYMEVARIAAGAKKQAKQRPGNCLFVNQRYMQSGRPVEEGADEAALTQY